MRGSSGGLASEPPSPHRFGGLLWQRNFRLLWFGETVSQVGNAMALVGVPLLAVITLHASAFSVGVLAASGYLPWLLIGLPVGAWVDRLPARAVMITCDVISAVLYASVPLASWAKVLTIGQLFGVQLLAGASNVMFVTAYQVYLPTLVDSGDLVEGNAKLQGSASAAAFGGRGLAGLFAQVVGTVFSLALNAGSFVVSLVCLVNIRPRQAKQPPTARGKVTLRGDIAQGIRLVVHDRYLRRLALFAAIANFALDGYGAILALFFVRVVGLKPDSIGLLIAVSGVGGLLAAMLVGRVKSRLGTARGLLMSALCLQPFGLLVPLTGHGLRLGLYVIGVLLASIGVTMSSIIIASFRQSYCPPEILGRVTATMWFLAMGATPIGAFTGGLLGTWLGTRNALWVMLSVLALSGTLLLTPDFIKVRDMPTAPAETAVPERSGHGTV
jgi:predicted MFS family arabinose efflux permease